MLNKKIMAAIASAAMLAGTATPLLSVSAGQLLGETSFEHKMLPWQTCESGQARQVFHIMDGELRIQILNGGGNNSEAWDLQLRHRGLNFRAGYKYTVSFKAKANREGLEILSQISNNAGNKEYFGLYEDKMIMGFDMGGQWDKPAKLSTEYQEYSGTFIPTYDIEACDWSFWYANGSAGSRGGNAKEGDEIWFDDMSIVCDECDGEYYGSFGAVSRDNSADIDRAKYTSDGKLNNYISVNQIGYYPNLSKVAVLGDNKGDIFYGSSTIDLTESTYKFNVCDSSTDEVVYSGTSGKTMKDKDSGDTVCQLDFTNFCTPGRYYISVGDWRSFDFSISDSLYSDSDNNMLTNVLNYFYQNRSGIDIEAKYITSGDKEKLAHEGSHIKDVASVQKGWKNIYSDKTEAAETYASSTITSNGGWYDASNYGKYVVNGGISVWTLQNMYERAIRTEEGRKKFADSSATVVIPESGNKIPDILDEAAYELDWMSTMVVKPDEPTWGKYAGLVYHKLQDSQWTGLAAKPDEYEKMWDTVRIVKPPTFAATLNYAACAAQAARLWEPYDAKKAAFYLDEAKKAYSAYEENYYKAGSEENREDSLYAPMYQSASGDPYGDNFVLDDAYWAACEIFVSAKQMNDADADRYFTRLSKFENAFEVKTSLTGGENSEYSLTSLNWGNTATAGTLTLALHRELLDEKEAKLLETSIISASDTYIKEEENQGYGIPYLFDGAKHKDPIGLPYSDFVNGYEWGSNSKVINNAIIMAYAYDLTHDIKYINGVTKGMDYLLGTNPLSFSYITGYGTYHVVNPNHKYWSNELDKSFPNAPDGVLSGGPNAWLQDNYVRALGLNSDDNNPSQRCYVDSSEAWSTNAVSLDWNSSLAWVVSFLQDENAGSVQNFKYGDIDENGKIEITDLTHLSLHLLKDKLLTGNALKAADVDASGKVDLADLAHLKQYVSLETGIVLGPMKK